MNIQKFLVSSFHPFILNCFQRYISEKKSMSEKYISLFLISSHKFNLEVKRLPFEDFALHEEHRYFILMVFPSLLYTKMKLFNTSTSKSCFVKCLGILCQASFMSVHVTPPRSSGIIHFTRRISSQ